jgi:hypothetical protein
MARCGGNGERTGRGTAASQVNCEACQARLGIKEGGGVGNGGDAAVFAHGFWADGVQYSRFWVSAYRDASDLGRRRLGTLTYCTVLYSTDQLKVLAFGCMVTVTVTVTVTVQKHSAYSVLYSRNRNSAVTPVYHLEFER